MFRLKTSRKKANSLESSRIVSLTQNSTVNSIMNSGNITVLSVLLEKFYLTKLFRPKFFYQFDEKRRIV
jgi:hypothetical protein